jgi:hypothetical protein
MGHKRTYTIEVYDSEQTHGGWWSMHTIKAWNESEALAWGKRIYGDHVRVREIKKNDSNTRTKDTSKD